MAGPGIDILHELGNRELSGSKKSLADVRALRTFDMESLYCLFSMPQRLAARCGVSTSST
jgi:hypothetical protein